MRKRAAAQVCSAEGCCSAPSRLDLACTAGLLVSYRPLAHVRFREETEPLRGEATSLVLLRAAGARGLARTCQCQKLARDRELIRVGHRAATLERFRSRPFFIGARARAVGPPRGADATVVPSSIGAGRAPSEPRRGALEGCAPQCQGQRCQRRSPCAVLDAWSLVFRQAFAAIALSS